MGLISDLLKDTPLAPELTARVRRFEHDKAALDTVVAFLKDENRDLKLKLQKAEEKVRDLEERLKEK